MPDLTLPGIVPRASCPQAVFSPCATCGTTALCGPHGHQSYRYSLQWPTGVDADTFALFVLANPSKATAEEADPTIRRCIGYARRWGYGWALIGNARAWRETDPDLVPPDPKAIGPYNDDCLRHLLGFSGIVVCGWGKLGGARGPEVLRLIRAAGKVPHALQLNKDGSPAHPLYLRGDLVPVAMGGAHD